MELPCPRDHAFVHRNQSGTPSAALLSSARRARNCVRGDGDSGRRERPSPRAHAFVHRRQSGTPLGPEAWGKLGEAWARARQPRSRRSVPLARSARDVMDAK